MLCFQHRPDAVFTEILNRAFDSIIFELEQDILLKISNFVDNYFDEKTKKMFGDTKFLLNEIKRLKAAHDKPEVYWITDYHYLLLDRMLRVFCDVYNDSVEEIEDYDGGEDDISIKLDGRPILELDFGFILSIFFWDTDYDMDIEVGEFMKNNPQIREGRLGMDIEGARASAGDLVDTNDLKIEKSADSWEDEKNWKDRDGNIRNNDLIDDETGKSFWFSYEDDCDD